MTQAIYLSDETFEALAAEIVALRPCAFAGRVTADQVKIALGEFGNMWPAAVRPFSLERFDRVNSPRN
jgi:hypothetical protein